MRLFRTNIREQCVYDVYDKFSFNIVHRTSYQMMQPGIEWITRMASHLFHWQISHFIQFLLFFFCCCSDFYFPLSQRAIRLSATIINIILVHPIPQTQRTMNNMWKHFHSHFVVYYLESKTMNVCRYLTNWRQKNYSN